MRDLVGVVTEAQIDVTTDAAVEADCLSKPPAELPGIGECFPDVFWWGGILAFEADGAALAVLAELAQFVLTVK